MNENDNSAIQEVVECFEDVAIEAQCAVHLWHHTRKAGGERATVEAARGAVAFIDACRSVRILETMTAKEHEQLLADAARHVAARGSTSAPSTASATSRRRRNNRTGFELKSIVLLNGDEIGVATTWTYPETWENMTPEIADVILAEIDRGMPDGQRYSNHNREPTASMADRPKHCPRKRRTNAAESSRTGSSRGAATKMSTPIRFSVGISSGCSSEKRFLAMRRRRRHYSIASSSSLEPFSAATFSALSWRRTASISASRSIAGT